MTHEEHSDNFDYILFVVCVELVLGLLLCSLARLAVKLILHTLLVHVLLPTAQAVLAVLAFLIVVLVASTRCSMKPTHLLLFQNLLRIHIKTLIIRCYLLLFLFSTFFLSMLAWFYRLDE